MGLTYKAPCAVLEDIENLWLQLSNVACNIKCKHCYLDCHQDTKKKNFLSLENIYSALSLKLKGLKQIYLTGGEPFLHPKFIEIVKLCLIYADVTICTNGTLLNEKKIKVLKALEDASQHMLTLRFSLDHFTEGRNDEYRARGVFKKVINALILADKYSIKTSLICVNLKNEDEQMLKNGFIEVLNKNNINFTGQDIKILPMLKMGNYSKFYNLTDIQNDVTFEDIENFDMQNLDCKNSRVITINGIYSCPALVNDSRGKLGNDLKNSENKVYLETKTCFQCVNRNSKLFG